MRSVRTCVDANTHGDGAGRNRGVRAAGSALAEVTSQESRTGRATDAGVPVRRSRPERWCGQTGCVSGDQGLGVRGGFGGRRGSAVRRGGASTTVTWVGSIWRAIVCGESLRAGRSTITVERRNRHPVEGNVLDLREGAPPNADPGAAAPAVGDIYSVAIDWRR